MARKKIAAYRYVLLAIPFVVIFLPFVIEHFVTEYKRTHWEKYIYIGMPNRELDKLLPQSGGSIRMSPRPRNKYRLPDGNILKVEFEKDFNLPGLSCKKVKSYKVINASKKAETRKAKTPKKN